MQQGSSLQKNIIIGVVTFIVLCGGGYYFYGIYNASASDSTAVQIDKSVLNKNVVEFLSSKDKIKLKDKTFMEGSLYKQLRQYTEEIPFLVPPGRKNPFSPVVQ